MNITSFSENLANGMNNPECSFWVGSFVGQWSTLKFIFILACLLLIYKALDKLVLDVLIKKIKDKFKIYK